ncbi:MAG: hypothetical protein ACKOX6_16800 [Bdellovibrio sp.]
MVEKTLEQLEQERRAYMEHQEVLKSLRQVLATPAGKHFVKYLFDSFDVGGFPEIGLPQEFLREHLGFMRSGQAIWKIVSEANPEVAGNLLAQIEKEKYAEKFNAQNERG